VNAIERQLRHATAPHEPESEARAWGVARNVYAERSGAPHSRPRLRHTLIPIVVLLAALLALSPAGGAVRRWIDQTLGIKHARPALFSLPAPGQILVTGRGGVWTIAADGSKRRLGAWTDATWSPHALYVAVAGRDQLAALNPRGVTQWSISRPDVRFPRWFTPNGYRLAYLSASTLRVIAGDGTGDRQLVGDAALVAPAWRPDHPYQLAYVRGDGAIVVRDADGGAIAWSRRVQPRPRMLAWSSDGRRLLVLTSDTALVYNGSGTRIARIARRVKLHDGALSPDGRRVALLGGGELTVTEIGGPTHHLFAGVGLRQAAWSPDGQWLLVSWPAANQWVFLRAGGHPRIVAVSRITQQFRSFPTINGWCCTARGRAS
jgi:hypothetical protein